MTTAKVFQSGNSQAVRLPREMRLDVSEVEITRHGDLLILRPIRREATLASATAFLYAASVMLLIRRLARSA